MRTLRSEQPTIIINLLLQTTVYENLSSPIFLINGFDQKMNGHYPSAFIRTLGGFIRNPGQVATLNFGFHAWWIYLTITNWWIYLANLLKNRKVFPWFAISRLKVHCFINTLILCQSIKLEDSIKNINNNNKSHSLGAIMRFLKSLAANSGISCGAGAGNCFVNEGLEWLGIISSPHSVSLKMVIQC